VAAWPGEKLPGEHGVGVTDPIGQKLPGGHKVGVTTPLVGQ